MASVGLFIFMVVMMIVLLLITAIVTTLASANLFNSIYYSSDSHIRSGHQLLTISTALCWSVLMISIVMVIVVTISGGLSSTIYSDKIQDSEDSPEDNSMLINYYIRELRNSLASTSIFLIILIILCITLAAAIILSAIAAIQIANAFKKDGRANEAYTESVIGTITGLLSIGSLIIGCISYSSYRTSRKEEESLLNDYLSSATAK